MPAKVRVGGNGMPPSFAAIRSHQTISSGFQRKQNVGGTSFSVKNGFEGAMNAPWRKTVSIFKQPVTLVRTTSKLTRPIPANELQSRQTRGKQDKPKQVFWAKRLSSMRAMMPVQISDIPDSQVHTVSTEQTEETNSDHVRRHYAEELEVSSTSESLGLPSRLQPIGPDICEDVAVASLASALQTPQPSGAGGAPQSIRPPITGQTNPKKHLDSNPGVYTNPEQPLIHAVVVSDGDITMQQKRVLDARNRLEQALKLLTKFFSNKLKFRFSKMAKKIK